MSPARAGFGGVQRQIHGTCGHGVSQPRDSFWQGYDYSCGLAGFPDGLASKIEAGGLSQKRDGHEKQFTRM